MSYNPILKVCKSWWGKKVSRSNTYILRAYSESSQIGHTSQKIKFPIKENAQFKNWSLNLSWVLSKTTMEVGNITKVATFFFHLSYKNTQLLFLWQFFLVFFMRKTLIDDFWWLHKNMNCAFHLRISIENVNKSAVLWWFFHIHYYQLTTVYHFEHSNYDFT